MRGRARIEKDREKDSPENTSGTRRKKKYNKIKVIQNLCYDIMLRIRLYIESN